MGKAAVYRPEPGNEAEALNENEVLTVLKIAIPPDLYVHYDDLARKQGLTVADLVIHRLRHCKDHNSVRPVYLSDAQRAHLESLTGKKPIDSGETALNAITAAFKFRVDQFEPVQLDVNQCRRIHIGVVGSQTPQSKLHDLVKRAVVRETGI